MKDKTVLIREINKKIAQIIDQYNRKIKPSQVLEDSASYKQLEIDSIVSKSDLAAFSRKDIAHFAKSLDKKIEILEEVSDVNSAAKTKLNVTDIHESCTSFLESANYTDKIGCFYTAVSFEIRLSGDVIEDLGDVLS